MNVRRRRSRRKSRPAGRRKNQRPPPHIEGPLSLAGDLTAVTRRLSCRTANRAWTRPHGGPQRKRGPPIAIGRPRLCG